MSHSALTSDGFMSPPNNQSRTNRTKTAQSMGFIQETSHPARRSHFNKAFLLNVAFSASCHPPHSPLTQKHISTQPQGRSQIVQKTNKTTPTTSAYRILFKLHLLPDCLTSFKVFSHSWFTEIQDLINGKESHKYSLVNNWLDLY